MSQSAPAALVIMLGIGCLSVDVHRGESPSAPVPDLATARLPWLRTDKVLPRISIEHCAAAALASYYAVNGVMLLTIWKSRPRGSWKTMRNGGKPSPAPAPTA